MCFGPFCAEQDSKQLCMACTWCCLTFILHLYHASGIGVLCRLMRSALLVLAMPRCLDASRNATLNVVESLIDLEGNLGYNILMAHVDQLLESLRAIAVTAWSTPVSFPVSLASSQGFM